MSTSFDAGLRTFLLADTDISAALAGVRLFNSRVEQAYAGQFPNAVFDIDLPMPNNDLSTMNEQCWEVKVTIYLATQSPTSTLNLASLFRDKLHYFTGNSMGGFNIDRIIIQGHSKSYELEPEIFISQIDFLIYSFDKPTFTT